MTDAPVPDERVAALQVATPPGWAEVALADLPATMSDHAHAERKAALGALSLLAREPRGPSSSARWPSSRARSCATSTRCWAICAVGAGRWRPTGPTATRAPCHALRRRGVDREADLCDRLLVAALIEARSWERLNLLGLALEGAADADLGAFYAELARSEAGHYRLFVELADRECPREDVAARLRELADAEAAIVRALPHEPRIH